MTETVGAELTRPASVGAMLLERVEKSGPQEAFRYLEGERWVSLTWRETKDRAYVLAAGLLDLGIAPEDRVAIASGTRIEWILADLGVMCAGAATTTVYPTTQHADVAYILSDSESKVIIAEDADQARKVLDHLEELPHVTAIVLIDGSLDHESVITWSELERRGREYLAAHPDAIDKTIDGIRPEQLATLIYTSGTTGRPKGVRLIQDCWTYEGVAVELYDLIGPDDLQYLWLPLSHVFGKALITIQLRVGFATAVEGAIDKIVDNLGVVQPTMMAGAPRIFEKVRAKVMMGASHGLKGKIFNWAFDIGYKTVPIRLAGRQPTGLLARRSTSSPTGSCSASSRRGWAARSGSSSPARRR